LSLCALASPLAAKNIFLDFTSFHLVDNLLAGL
jgi:hypothetical protein